MELLFHSTIFSTNGMELLFHSTIFRTNGMEFLFRCAQDKRQRVPTVRPERSEAKSKDNCTKEEEESLP